MLSLLFIPNHRDISKEILYYLDYPDILNLVQINREFDNLGKTTYADLVKTKRIEFLNQKVKLRMVEESSRTHAFISYVKDGNVVLVDHMINYFGVDPSRYSSWAMVEACKKGNIHVVNRLLEDSRVIPGDMYNVSIKTASLYGHLVIVNRLLEDPRVNPSAIGNRSIHCAFENGYMHIVSRLLKERRVIKNLSWKEVREYSDIFKYLPDY